MVGAPYARRGPRLAEYVACLRALWADDPVAFSGAFYEIPASRMRPKPVQRPAPPILLGGTAEPALRRIGRIADGWISSSRQNLTEVGTAVTTIRDAAQEAGRDPAALRFVVRSAAALGEDVRTDDGERRQLTGTAEEIRDDLGRLSQVGVTEVFLDLNFAPAVGSPDLDPIGAEAHAHEVLETFSPR